MENLNCLFEDQENGIEYVLAQECHKQEVIKLLAATFSGHEPVSVARGVTEQQWEFMFNMSWEAGIVRNKISVVAMEKASNKVVGAFICEDQTYPGVGICEGLGMEWRLWKHDKRNLSTMITAMDKVTEPLWEEHKRLVKFHNLTSEHTVSVDMLAIAVDANFGKRGIGSKLSELCLKLIREKGFYIVYSQVSSAFSKKAIEKLGLTSQNSIDYKTYMVPGSCGSLPTYPFSGVQEPHTGLHLIWLNLK